jgi:hypothetical protein
MKTEARAGDLMTDTNPDQIIPIPLGAANAYLVNAGRKAIVIDAGNKGKEHNK